MRMATVMAAAAATGGLGGLGGAALRRGVKMLGSTETLGKFAPQLGELADTVRSDLMDAGKSAATAALTSRIESLTDSLHERAEMVRDPGAAAADAGRGAGKAARSGAGKARSAAAGATRRARRGQDVEADEETAEPNGEEESYPEDIEEQEDYEPEAEEEAEEPEAEEEAEEPEPAPVRRRTTRRRSPVARAGR
jgi:chemotaxis protein histidine kinase CheA